MKILFIGDISGRPGRETIKEVVPELKKREQIDFVIANCENVSSGIAVTRKAIDELLSYGIDFFTSGDHVWRDRDFLFEIQNENIPLVRPYNYEYQHQLPGKGFKVVDLGKNGQIVIANLIGQVFMAENVRNPFFAADEMLREIEEQGIDASETPIIIDFHAEATAEKISLAHYLQGRVAAVLGTHTHVGTIDNRIFDGTAFVSDTGMVGPYNASLWAAFPEVIHNFKFPFKQKKQMEKSGDRIFNSVIISLEKGKSISIKRLDKILQ